MWRAMGADTLPADLAFTQIGTWWGAKDREIDIVGLDANDKVVLIGECKWRESPIDVSDYADMLTDIKICGADIGIDPNVIGTLNSPWLVMFSRSGFTPRLEELANNQQPPRLLLIALNDMYEI